MELPYNLSSSSRLQDWWAKVNGFKHSHVPKMMVEFSFFFSCLALIFKFKPKLEFVEFQILMTISSNLGLSLKSI